MTVGEKLAEMRKERAISQEKLAEMLGVSRQAVTKWENGRSNPDTENLIRLAGIFGISLDELCGNEKTERPNANIHPLSHVMAALSVLAAAAYGIIGGINGSLSAGTLVCLIVLAVPMHCFTHLIFGGMVKSGDFSMLAGYDPNVKYNTEEMKHYVAGMDFMLGTETLSYVVLMAATALIAPQFDIITILLFGYIFSFIAGIFFMGYKFGSRIYVDQKDAEAAKRGMPASVILVTLLMLAVIAFVALFEVKGYENNDVSVFPMLGMMFVSIGFALGGYLAESQRLKKADEHAPRFGKAFAVLNILSVASAVLMAFI